MKRIIFCIFSFLLFFNTVLFAQSITWQKVYNGGERDDEANDICQSSDGLFYTVGYANNFGNGGLYVLKFNAFGDSIWSRTINNIGDALTVTATNDAGIVITGYDIDSTFAIKLNSAGNIVWQKFYSGTYIACYDIEQTNNGNFIVCGSSIYAPFAGGYVMKIDSEGNLIWRRGYSNGNCFYKIEEAIDGGYILSGYGREQHDKAWLLKIDTAGNPVWEKRFRLTANTTGAFLAKLQDGYIIAGNTTDSIVRPFFTRTTINGDTIFSNIFRFEGDEYLLDFKIANNNRYIFTFLSVPLPLDSMARVIVTDSTGSILHHRIFNYGEYATFHSILPLSNGDILLAGSAEPPQGSWYDVYLARTDSNLNAPPIGIENENEIFNLPLKYKLYQNYPNPFNPITTIKYEIPVGNGRDRSVKINVYDITGREILSINEYRQAGVYTYSFDGTNLASGVYIYKVESNSFSETRKMVLIK